LAQSSECSLERSSGHLSEVVGGWAGECCVVGWDSGKGSVLGVLRIAAARVTGAQASKVIVVPLLSRRRNIPCNGVKVQRVGDW
jgi:hypothetical protein